MEASRGYSFEVPLIKNLFYANCTEAKLRLVLDKTSTQSHKELKVLLEHCITRRKKARDAITGRWPAGGDTVCAQC